jgi:uncharacterized protein with von Willebrand factor type A (vWA) domain
VALVGFVAELRRAGLEVAVDQTRWFTEAVVALGGAELAALYWAGRSTLVSRPADIAVYDQVFASVWRGLEPVRREREIERVSVALDDLDDEAEVAEPSDDDEDESTQVITVRFSPHDVLRHKDFAAYTDAELDEARRLMADRALVGAMRRSRRRRRSRHERGRLDLRRTVQAALRTGGEPFAPRRTRASERPRRVVLLCDISGSMEPYSRALMRFAQAVAAGARPVEVFALGTRLTRLTRELSGHDPDEALARAAAAVPDWSGGTRLGAGLREFNDRWGVRGTARGAIVVVLSDGWDRGDPEELSEQMARLARVAHRIVWVNPLKATPGYAPLARGMAASLPFVDRFVAGHTLAALEELADVIRETE